MNDLAKIDEAISQLRLTRPKNLVVKMMTEEERAKLPVFTPNSYFKKKYRLALEISTKMMVQGMYEKHPNWTTQDVLVASLKEYNSDLPSSILLEMAQIIVIEWEKIQASKKELVLT
jgi:hypothetical protein